MGRRIVMNKGGNGKVHKQVAEEQAAENAALDSWMWILRARAAARQAVEGVVPPQVPTPEDDHERQSSPPE